MDTLIYGDGTKIILLRMKRRFQIYISFVENIKDNCEKLPESGLKCLNKCRFKHLRTIAHSARKHRIQDQLLRFLDSSRDEEHDDAQFLQIGVSMAKLQPLLNHRKFFMKCIFCTKFL